MTVSTRVWTPFEEFELEFDDVLPAWLGVARTRAASIEAMNRCFTIISRFRVARDDAIRGLNR
jgi:hypothetical protein